MMTKTEITRTSAGFAVRVVPTLLGSPAGYPADWSKRHNGIAGRDCDRTAG
jgi:hypothetical protein